MSDRHVALIVEDEEGIAAIEKRWVASLGHEWRHAVTLEDVREAVAAREYCYVLLDMQIPADRLSRESVGCGETAFEMIRRASPERMSNGKYALPVIVVTGFSREPDFISKMYEAFDADGFIAKPFGDRHDLLLDKIRGALARTGRTEHAQCKCVGRKSAPPPVEAGRESLASAPRESGSARVEAGGVVRIAIDGKRLAARTDVVVNGVRGTLQDALFVVFLNMVCAHLKSPGAWTSAAKLGMARNDKAASRIRAALKGLVPAGFEIVETQKTVGFRLNPAVVVEGVEWGALREHGQAGVRRVAGEFVPGGR